MTQFTHSQSKATFPRNSNVQNKDALMAKSSVVGPNPYIVQYRRL